VLHITFTPPALTAPRAFDPPQVQSFDQEFSLCNEALRVSCAKGLPVRVLRSYKEKRSAYAPTDATPVRYDGVYRIVKAWRKPGLQGPLVCRYLFVRADNEPAPWSSGGELLALVAVVVLLPGADTAAGAATPGAVLALAVVQMRACSCCAPAPARNRGYFQHRRTQHTA
jgi:hypothetical protein